MSDNANNKSLVNAKKLLQKSVEEVMKESMLPYAEYVILDRAIPRVEDGLKPVQRRILYTMLELGITPDKPHRKSARIVGDCLGKFHPHGDSSVYDAMVRMAQGFNMMAPLVDGHGNFGSVDGDPAAAMRYTEARMTPLAMELLKDLEKDTVEFSLNFDDSMKEPNTLPAKFPNLLVNGATGIAVGLATNIPPHNLNETVNAAIAMLDDPDISLKKIMKKIKAPDFPTGGYILGAEGLASCYENGNGKIAIRAKTHFEKGSAGRTLIVVDELPYQVNKATALEKILKVTETRKNLFAGIMRIRDESDRNGMRAVVELRKEADPGFVLQCLYKYSDLQINFSMNMVAIADGKPKQLGLLEILKCYIDYQKKVITRRTKFELAAAEKRAHILEGMIIAIDNLDEVIAIIRASQSTSQAKKNLMKRFDITEIQAQAILDIRLQRLVALQIIELRKELADLGEKIAYLRGILSDEGKLSALIKSELEEINKKYKTPRKSPILDEMPDIEINEDEAMPSEEVVVRIGELGLQKYLAKNYDKAKAGFEEENDRTYFEIECMSNSKINIFTSIGNMHTVDVDEIPEIKGREKGMIVSGIVAGWQDNEKILNVFVLTDIKNKEATMLFFTKKGMAKRNSISEFETRYKRLSAGKLRDGDEYISIELDQGSESVICVTKKGMSIRFDPSSIPEGGRVALGVKVIALKNEDEVICAEQIKDGDEYVISISDGGYINKAMLLDYEMQNRNGKGLKTFDFTKSGSNGNYLASALVAKSGDEIVIRQRKSGETTMDVGEMRAGKRHSKGKAVVMAVLDDIVEEVYRRRGI